jgi:hypothetical protein
MNSDTIILYAIIVVCINLHKHRDYVLTFTYSGFSIDSDYECAPISNLGALRQLECLGQVQSTPFLHPLPYL